MSQPRVSVIVPSYNHRQFLRRRLQSIFEQTFQDFEVILLDDASSDGSAEILREYARDARVTALVVNDSNVGVPCVQWVRGLALAKGDLVWIAESDDWAEPTLLATLVRCFDETPDLTLAYCRSDNVDEHDRRVSDDFWPDAVDPERWRASFVADARREVARYLGLRNTIPNASAVLFRRSAAEQLDVPRDMRFAGDWAFWIGLLATGGRVAFRAERLNHFRVTATSSRHARSSRAERARLAEYVRAIGLADAVIDMHSLSAAAAHGWLVEKYRERGHRHPFWLLTLRGVAWTARLCLAVYVSLPTYVVRAMSRMYRPRTAPRVPLSSNPSL